MIALLKFYAKQGWARIPSRLRFAIALLSLVVACVGIYVAINRFGEWRAAKGYAVAEAKREAERQELDKQFAEAQEREAAANAEIARLKVDIKARDVLIALADAETRRAQEEMQKEEINYEKDVNSISQPSSSVERVADICERLRRNSVPNGASICAKLKAAYSVGR